jgi:ribonucleoside-triphosphate reductase
MNSANTIMQSTESYRLPYDVIEKYKYIKPEFGFNGLGEVVYKRTYSRLKDDGSNEEWYETVARVVNGTMSMSKRWMVDSGLGWDDSAAVEMATELYDRIFTMKFLPPGRGLWAMGSPITEEKRLFASLNNCAYVSTEGIAKDVSKCFEFMMDMAMLGVGVGFDTKGKGKIIVRGTRRPTGVLGGCDVIHTVEDTREGWVKSLKMLIDSYFTESYGDVQFNYSLVRPSGQPIKGFGGVSSGPDPLILMHQQIRIVLEKNKGSPITATTIVDIMNLIGKCVVSGNVRRYVL